MAHTHRRLLETPPSLGGSLHCDACHPGGGPGLRLTPRLPQSRRHLCLTQLAEDSGHGGGLPTARCFTTKCCPGLPFASCKPAAQLYPRPQQVVLLEIQRVLLTATLGGSLRTLPSVCCLLHECLLTQNKGRLRCGRHCAWCGVCGDESTSLLESSDTSGTNRCTNASRCDLGGLQRMRPDSL